jgi:16S rRNA (cytidine1402-2'-O)-methyltransferase
VTSKLLARFEVRVPLMRADEHTIASRVALVIDRVDRGERVAFVSDAGMPCVSDPGQRLVDACLDAGVHVEVIPGPSAVTCALAASGLASEHFFFEGFLPRKAGPQRRRLETLASFGATLVIYESPRRIASTLAQIADAMPARRVALVRELTKVHEECLRDLAPALAERLADVEVRGECVIVVEGEREGEEVPAPGSREQATLEEAMAAGIAAGEAKSALAKRLAKAYGLSRSEVYERLVDLGDAG